jgi:hypothetical protein
MYDFSMVKRIEERLSHSDFGRLLDSSHLGRPHAGSLGMRLNVIAEKEDAAKILVITSSLPVAA